MKRIIIILLGLSALPGAGEIWATQFAVQVVSYKSGVGFATDWSTGAGYTDTDSIVGPPTSEMPGKSADPITPFSPPYLLGQILSIGEGGEVTVKFAKPIRDESINPFGLDFLVFGGAGFTITNGDFSGGGITDGTLFGQADGETRVSVSVDGEVWFELDPKRAPAFDAYHPTAGSGDFGLPVNPDLAKSDFAGGGLSTLTRLYDGSGGGTGYDLGWAIDADGKPVTLSQVRFVQLKVLSGRAEIDAISDVKPRTDKLDWHFENFSANPLANDWAVHGDESLFEWDEESGLLAVTWDSEKPNSYFHRPLGLTLTEADTFVFAFEIALDEVRAGHLNDQPYTFEVALGLINSNSAKADGFSRGTGSDSPNLVEWDYFPDTGFGATISPAIASTKSQFAAGFTFPAALSAGKKYFVRMEYGSHERTLKTFMLENGDAWKEIESVKLEDDFSGFAVDAFSISSYTAKGSTSSLFAKGSVDNLAISVARSQPRIVDARMVDGEWSARAFGFGATGYLLERSADLHEWHSVENGVIKDGFYLRLIDENPLPGDVFYRLSR